MNRVITQRMALPHNSLHIIQKICTIIIVSGLYHTLNPAVDLSLLSKNQFILINKTGDDIYYTYKTAFVPKVSGKAALPKISEFKGAGNKLEEDHLKALGTLSTDNKSIFILLVSTDPNGEAPVAVYYFHNPQKRVFLEVTAYGNDLLRVNPLPNQKSAEPLSGKACIDSFGTKSYSDSDVIPSKDAKGKDAAPGVCLNLADNILSKDLETNSDIKGEYGNPATDAKFETFAHKLEWIS